MITVKNKVLVFNDTSYKCAIGKNGLTRNKFEGDKCTPVGTYSIETIYYRSDKLILENVNFDKVPIEDNFGWCDDVSSSHYNKFITFPFKGSAEHLYRDDDIYDIVCVLNYNMYPVVKKRGSAIFLHIANEDCYETLGCIAISKINLIKLLENIGSNEEIHILD